MSKRSGLIHMNLFMFSSLITLALFDIILLKSDNFCYFIVVAYLLSGTNVCFIVNVVID